MAYTDIDDPSAYFQTKLYTGNGGTNAITFDGNSDLQPDWVWIKNRTLSGGYAHNLFDSVRGTNKKLVTNDTRAETSETNGLNSFNSDGFTLGEDSGTEEVNRDGGVQVSWNWKKSADAGFDIVSYTGNATARTISHSLSAVPAWMIIKCRSESGHSWKVYHRSIGATKTLALQNNSTPDDDNNYHDDTEPTSSVFTIGSNGDVNDDGETFIAYLFAEKKGYSKFGKYSAVGNVDGNFIYLGFKPAFFLAKRITDGTESWIMFDNKRGNPFNGVHKSLKPNLAEGESNQNPPSMDFLSNGVKFRNIDGTFSNTAGKEFIYMAFAEQPFVTSTGVPATAR